MYKPVLRVGISYLAITAIYYITSSIIFYHNREEGGNAFVQFLNALIDIFYWASVHMYYMMFLLGSSIVGMIFSKMKHNKEYFVIFRNIFIVVVVFILVFAVLNNI